jgi:hypothetical protein
VVIHNIKIEKTTYNLHIIMFDFEYSHIDTLSHFKWIVDNNYKYEDYIKRMINADCWKITVLSNDNINQSYTDNILTDDKINIPEGHVKILNNYINRDQNLSSNIRQDFTNMNDILSTYKEIRIYMFCDLEYLIVGYGGDFLKERLANGDSPFKIYNKI